jgi:gliding motility-associated-like protein
VCLGDSTTLTIENIAKTAADFASDNDLIFITNNGEPVTWPTQYGKTYFMIQKNTNQPGFSPIDWPDAKTLTDNYNSGDSNASARMYVILNADMEKAVYDGLNSMGLTGDDGVAFWLGLYQDTNDTENYSEPDGGWKWVNGQLLKDTGYSNWWNGEPNDAGNENHGQFEFSGNGIKWNDMSVGNTFGQSWPLFEYSGSTDIVWGYYDDDGNPVNFTDQPGTGNLAITPEKTTTYFVKVTVNGINCIAETTITVNPNPTAEIITIDPFCDDDLDGDPNNGSITIDESFFNDLKPSILGTNQSVNNFSVSYHTTIEDVESGSNPITFPYTTPLKDASSSHWESMTTKIFVRVTNNDTGCVNYETSFDLTVNTLPVVFEVEDMIECEEVSGELTSTFDLETRTNELRSGNTTTDPNNTDNQSPANFPVTYHLSLDDANDLTKTGITSPFKSASAKIFYRIQRLDNNGNLICFKTGEAFDIVVEILPIANQVTIARQCDGDSQLDNDSQDKSFPFDTSGVQEKLLNGQTDVTTYYYDENDVFIGNTLPAIFETSSQTIRIRVENNTPQKCYAETTLEFIVDDSPEVYDVNFPVNCDDGDSDIDGYSKFNTTSVIQTLLTNPETNQTQSLNDFSVSFNFVDENGDRIDASSLPNPFNTKSQTVIATVTNKINPNCTITKEIDFTVVPLPVIKENLIKIEQCDDGKGADNDGVTVHNLTETQFLFSDNYEDEIFEYYTDINLTQKIEDPTTFENDPLYDEVWLKITTENGCVRTSKTQNGTDRLKIEITVGASEIPESFIEDNNTIYSICDDSPALTQNGISVFSNSVIKDIYDKLVASREIFQDQNIRVTLHRNSEDGLTGENPININEDFTNSIPNVQEIWARIVNIDVTKFTCLGYAKVGELYIEPRPIANAVTIDRQCDGDNELDLDSQDGIYPFDVSLIEEQVINGQTDVTVTYFNEDGTQIQNFSPVFESASQTITIRVEKDPSYPNITNPDGLCYDETTLEFIVDDSPEAYPVILAPHCDGDDGGDDTDEYDIFDTSNIITTLTTNPLTGISQDVSKLNIQFTYVNEDGDTVTASELPNPFNTKTQKVIVTVENPLNLNCIITDEIDFIVNPLPSFTVDDDTIVCLNLPPIPIGVTSSEAEYTYTWEHEDLNGNLSPFPVSGPTIDIGVGGTYYVTATTTDGTNCSRTLSIDVEESIIATITPNDITVEDLTNDNNNTITIDPTNLGIGDYEYAIDDPAGPYQNDPFFEQVRPGIHTIYIRDKNDCGIAQIDVSVIGYKKFFTPNGDGIHDTWRILGIREDFQPNSKVYIFDRYGKLLKDLDPVAEGWDGTFIGRPMPQTDYWFRVFLEDGREFKGHFSLVRGTD